MSTADRIMKPPTTTMGTTYPPVQSWIAPVM